MLLKKNLLVLLSVKKKKVEEGGTDTRKSEIISHFKLLKHVLQKRTCTSTYEYEIIGLKWVQPEVTPTL